MIQSLAVASLVAALCPLASTASAQSQTAPSHAESVERTFMVGPMAAAELGLVVAWQVKAPASDGTDLVNLFPLGSTFATTSSTKVVSRLDTATGDLLWQQRVSSSIDKIRGVTILDESQGERVLVVTDTDVIVLNGITGSPQDFQKLQTFPSSSAARFGPYLIYGSKTGILQWQQIRVGVPWRKNKLRGSIEASPRVSGSRVVAASVGGTVMMLDAATADEIWTLRLSGGVHGEMAFADGTVYFGSDDQYVYALDAASGRTKWRHFNDKPVRSSVSLLGDLLITDLQTDGLTCLEAKPEGLSARVLWNSPDLHGQAIARTGGALLVWSSGSKVLTSVDAATGKVLAKKALPEVVAIRTTDPLNGDLFLLASDGRIERLTSESQSIAAPANAGTPAAPPVEGSATDSASAQQ